MHVRAGVGLVRAHLAGVAAGVAVVGFVAGAAAGAVGLARAAVVVERAGGAEWLAGRCVVACSAQIALCAVGGVGVRAAFARQTVARAADVLVLASNAAATKDAREARRARRAPPLCCRARLRVAKARAAERD